jgi:hypothetical protein
VSKDSNQYPFVNPLPVSRKPFFAGAAAMLLKKSRCHNPGMQTTFGRRSAVKPGHDEYGR